ncbi:MAG TPA: HEPN domain-containing protein [Candidatus Acidoferrum sp.]|nr:HEPN domain-containing protein [Candidatus Acidoferrum sp.]
MTGHFEALAGFTDSLAEVDILCEAADAASSDRQKSSTFNKAALLLIAGKFESFAESIVEEFVFKLNECRLPCDRIPTGLRLQHTFGALSQLERLRQPGNQEEAAQLFRRLGTLWATTERFDDLALHAKLAFGRHGEGELIKLFEKLGIPDIFDVVQLAERVETLSSDAPVEAMIDFRGIFNSVTAMRNNILHEDASPNLSSSQIKGQRRFFEQFAVGVSSHLAQLLHRCQNQSC